MEIGQYGKWESKDLEVSLTMDRQLLAKFPETAVSLEDFVSEN
jgi:hypothetical protein